MSHRDILAVLFGLHVIWTGLWRNIQAAAYKPNALWFCLTLGIIAIIAGFLYRKGRERVASITAFFSAAVILAFYFRESITKPETEANVRVGLVILSSIAMLVVILFPRKQQNQNS